jgi:uncharacterized protein
MPRAAASIVAIILLTLCGIARAAFPWEHLSLGGAVNDYAGLLNANERSSLEESLREYQRRSGNALVLVTLDSLGGGDADDAANRIFAKAGIGEKGKDNGVLLLISLQDRVLRIEVGYGLESTLTDAVCAAIIRRDIAPAFREGKHYEGLASAFANMEKIIGGEEVVRRENNPRAIPPFVVFLLLLFGLPILVFISWVTRLAQAANPNARTYRRGGPPWPGGMGGGGFGGGFGGGGGGFGGFGGGMSGGGGARGGW